MTTVLIDDKTVEEVNLEYINNHPYVAQIVDEFDNMPLPVPEDELVTLEEFKLHMEALAYKRLGLKLIL